MGSGTEYTIEVCFVGGTKTSLVTNTPEDVIRELYCLSPNWTLPEKYTDCYNRDVYIVNYCKKDVYTYITHFVVTENLHNYSK